MHCILYSKNGKRRLLFTQVNNICINHWVLRRQNLDSWRYWFRGYIEFNKVLQKICIRPIGILYVSDYHDDKLTNTGRF